MHVVRKGNGPQLEIASTAECYCDTAAKVEVVRD